VNELLPVAALCVLELPPIQVPNLHRYTFNVTSPVGELARAAQKEACRAAYFIIMYSSVETLRDI
jgi:hypothetical protein